VKWFTFLLTAFTASAFAQDAILVEQVSCYVAIRRVGADLLVYGQGGENRLILAYGAPMKLQDTRGGKWRAGFSSTSDVPATKEDDVLDLPGALLIKKSVLNKVSLVVEFSTNSFARKIKGKYSRIRSDQYTLSAGTGAASPSLGMHAGSFSTEMSQHLSCDIKSREVDFAEYSKYATQK
jgi:hypothetical protein